MVWSISVSHDNFLVINLTFFADGFQRAHNYNYGILRLCSSEIKCASLLISTSGMLKKTNALLCDEMEKDSYYLANCLI